MILGGYGILSYIKKKTMPRSKKRSAHHAPQQHAAPIQSQGRKMSVSGRLVIVFFFALIGLCAGFMLTEESVAWKIAATIIGAACGYLFARQIEKSFSKK